ncbi:hypothetical protein GCM10027037_18020 [Mucilaginibacter koreensis]
MNKKVLKVGADLDFELIAITSALKDYRVCFLINKHLNFNFRKEDDLKVDIYKNSVEPALFSLYHYQWETTETDFYFIANRGSDGLLIPEMRQADYFLMIRNYIDTNDLNEIISGLNTLPEIISAIKIDPKKIKSNENLLF